MTRRVKHFSLHRIDGTELRVVSDVDDGVLPVIQVEEEVIRGYIQHGLWPHESVTLFILQDLQPLIHQIQPTVGASTNGLAHGSGALGLGGIVDLDSRPLLNVYDLANPSGCQVFINRETMMREGYWEDLLAIRGLLAHEHAHPLAENETTKGSRELDIELEIAPLSSGQETQHPQWTGIKEDVIRDFLKGLARKLCIYAPREIFANEVVIRSGFGDALLHLDQRNIANARSSLAGRENLKAQFQLGVNCGNLTPAAANVLLIIGDLQSYMDLALEVAPFYRSGHESEAREMETVLENGIFPYLEPQVSQVYAALVREYVSLQPDLTQGQLSVRAKDILSILVGPLADKGLILSAECVVRNEDS